MRTLLCTPPLKFKIKKGWRKPHHTTNPLLINRESRTSCPHKCLSPVRSHSRTAAGAVGQRAATGLPHERPPYSRQCVLSHSLTRRVHTLERSSMRYLTSGHWRQCRQSARTGRRERLARNIDPERPLQSPERSDQTPPDQSRATRRRRPKHDKHVNTQR